MDFKSKMKQSSGDRKTFKFREADAFTDLKTEESEKGRFYITPEGNAYPSITTVLKIVNERSIMEWRKRVGEEKANEVSTKASRRGTAVHYMCEDYINNVEDYTSNKMPADIELFNKMKPILDEKIDDVWAQEAPLYSDFLGLAGRVDCIANWDGKLSIIDFKTSKKLKKKEWIETYFMQCAAYAIMFEERTGVPITQLVVFIGVDGEEPQIFTEHRDTWATKLMQVRKDYQSRYGV